MTTLAAFRICASLLKPCAIPAHTECICSHDARARSRLSPMILKELFGTRVVSPVFNNNGPMLMPLLLAPPESAILRRKAGMGVAFVAGGRGDAVAVAAVAAAKLLTASATFASTADAPAPNVSSEGG